MGRNVWKFLRLEDGTYAVYHRGNRLAEGIPAEWREEEFCIRWGFCGEECGESYTRWMSRANARLFCDRYMNLKA